jgi:arylsulfatase
MFRRALFVGLALLPGVLVAAEGPPSFLIVVADDLGFSDLGCFGGEIATPRLNRLAADGLRFTQFYNTARCWPTRASLLTGYYAQQIRRDTVEGVISGGRGVRPDWAPLVTTALGEHGYRCYHSGKWHIDGQPLKNGFDRSYLIQNQGNYFSPKNHLEDDVRLPDVPDDGSYYSTIAIADHAIRCLKDHQQSFADRPFFQYVAFTAPHFPLHALPEDIARYRDRYTAGWEVLRAERWERIQKMGLITHTLSEVEREIGPPYDFPDAFEKLGPGEVNRPLPWDSLTPEQRAFQATKMAIHGAMVDRMDRELGRILDQLQAMNAWENTFILFLSDNGASAEIMVRDGGHDPAASLGSAATYLCLGPGWSTVCNTPFRRHKTWVHEGGIATPAIVHWPAKIADKGSWRQTPQHVIDVVPTVLELSGASFPARVDRPAPPGQSFASVLGVDANNANRPLWWLHEGNRAIRVGNWKLVAARDDPWELYDLSVDRCETSNLASQRPEKVRELANTWEALWGGYQQQARGE